MAGIFSGSVYHTKIVPKSSDKLEFRCYFASKSMRKIRQRKVFVIEK